MSKLNRDILCLIFEELQDHKRALLSCLLVNRTWCEIIIPIFWKNPWKYLKWWGETSFLNVIISHLSDESRNNLSEILTNSYKRPLFDYINFCKHLNLSKIEWIIGKSKLSLNKDEIFNLFINKKTKF